VLGPYWLLPWLLVSRGTTATAPRLAAAIALHTIGVAVMLSADAQKHFVLRERHGLVCDGMHARTRHPTYTGEMMVYGAYALLVQHWLAWAILVWVWTAIFLVNILTQEASLARHPAFAEWKARSGLLLPRLF
jgi:protein-S-isoprenylcysteine O-methyltransferase Ste14